MVSNVFSSNFNFYENMELYQPLLYVYTFLIDILLASNENVNDLAVILMIYALAPLLPADEPYLNCETPPFA